MSLREVTVMFIIKQIQTCSSMFNSFIEFDAVLMIINGKPGVIVLPG